MTLLSAEEAVQIFDELASMDLPFGYIGEGCYARAHIMCRYLEDKGLEVDKAWLIEDRARHMRPVLPGDDEASAPYWAYHVAPSLMVEKPDGEVVRMVFDPSLFDGPAESDEWAFMVDPDPREVVFKRFGQPPDGYHGDYTIISNPEFTTKGTDAKARLVCEKHTDKLGGVKERSVFRSDLRKALENDVLSSDFSRQSNPNVRVHEQSDIERVRTIPYWERDPDFDEFGY